MTILPSTEFRGSTTRLVDFSGEQSSGEAYLEASPRTVADTARLVRVAHERGWPLRTRGQGHSLNGSSLPRAREALLRTDQLTHVRLAADGRASVGAGVVVWDLEAWLRRHGRRLPIFHGGGQPAPSIGGWVAAGGVADSSIERHGLWAVVEELIVVRADGVTQRVAPSDELFPWLFGSMGQLGVIAEVTLRTVASDLSRPNSPIVGARLEPRRTDAPLGVEARLQWFNLICTAARVPHAAALLDELQVRYRETYEYESRYAYEVRPCDVRPPLLWPDDGPFWLVGVWGRAKGEASAVKSFEHAFNKLAVAHGFRRYIQAEVGSGEQRFRNALGDQFESLLRWKTRLDPWHRLNRGSVFTPPVA